MTITCGRPDPLQIKLTKMTPAKCQQFLAKSAKNRPIRPEAIATWCTDLKHQRWQLNGETIKFNKSGLMVDGQHRCHAGIKTGVTFWTYVAYGIADDAIHSIDVGPGRSPGDFLSLHGVKHASLVASTAKRFHDIAEAQPVKSDGHRWRCRETLKSRAVLRNYINKYPVMLISAETIVGLKAGLIGWLAPSLLSGFHAYATTLTEEETATEFATSLSTGEDLKRGSPILKVRARLSKESSRPGQRISLKIKTRLIILAWNRWITDTKVGDRGMNMSTSTEVIIPKVLKFGDLLAKEQNSKSQSTNYTAHALKQRRKKSGDEK